MGSQQSAQAQAGAWLAFRHIKDDESPSSIPAPAPPLRRIPPAQDVKPSFLCEPVNTLHGWAGLSLQIGLMLQPGQRMQMSITISPPLEGFRQIAESGVHEGFGRPKQVIQQFLGLAERLERETAQRWRPGTGVRPLHSVSPFGRLKQTYFRVNRSNTVIAGSAFPSSSKKPRLRKPPVTAGSHQKTPRPR